MTRLRVTEALDLDLEAERWLCNRCDADLGPAAENYKHGCLVHERDPREVHAPVIEGEYTFSPDPDWMRIVEYYCPGCAVQIETEYLPPGHPLTHDIAIDVGALKARLAAGEIAIVDGRIARAPRGGAAGEGP